MADSNAVAESSSAEGSSIEERAQKWLDQALHAGGSEAAQKLRNFLNGTWLGEPLHIVLTDVPIGAWTTSLVFDAMEMAGGKETWAKAADASIAIGLVGAAGAAATGLTDWSDVDPPARRIGMYHGLLNVGATALYLGSLAFRKREMRMEGRLCALLGFALVGLSSKLGGKMVYQYGVGVDRTLGETAPEKFTAVMEESELKENKPARAEWNQTPILLVRRGERVFAMAETCSHFGGPLAEGKLEGDSIVCPWHGSRFALEDGHVIDGPAVHPQPCFEARVRNGKIEVRQPQRDPEAEGMKGMSTEPTFSY